MSCICSWELPAESMISLDAGCVEGEFGRALMLFFGVKDCCIAVRAGLWLFVDDWRQIDVFEDADAGIAI